jgi:hypothetical protein
MPGLAQLDQAVREFMAENPKDSVTVVVDASFGHRIDPSELPTFEEAEAAGEVISPPAGAIGRGDAFLLRIAEKTGATVLSNDSFQEFHGEHPWLFDKGRLVGGKPVPGVGWIFMERTPVRGHKSREVVKEARRRKQVEVEPVPSKVDSVPKTKNRPKSVDRAIARATEEVVQPSGQKSRRRRAGVPPAEPVNEPLAFITFIAAHPLGSEVVGTVLEYSSHGAFVEADGARCYMPLSAMGNPPPRRAREVVQKGEMGTFDIQAFDPQRRGIELAMPGFATVAGSPTDETVEAEISSEVGPKRAGGSDRRAKAKRTAAVATTGAPTEPPVTPEEPAGLAEPGKQPEAAPVLADAGPLAAGPPTRRRREAVSWSTPSTVKSTDGDVPAKRAPPRKKAVAIEKETPPAATGAGPKKPAGAKKSRAAIPALPVAKAVAPKRGSAATKTPGKKAAPAKKAAPVKKVARAKKAAAVTPPLHVKKSAVAKTPAAGKRSAASAVKDPKPVKTEATKRAAAPRTKTVKTHAPQPAKQVPRSKKAEPAKKVAAAKRAR